MLAEFIVDEAPPPYSDADNNNGNEILRPATLVLIGQTIHESSTESTPSYRVDLGIASLTHSTTKVEFERFERNVATTAGGGTGGSGGAAHGPSVVEECSPRRTEVNFS